jgi:hypothetical protein
MCMFAMLMQQGACPSAQTQMSGWQALLLLTVDSTSRAVASVVLPNAPCDTCHQVSCCKGSRADLAVTACIGVPISSCRCWHPVYSVARVKQPVASLPQLVSRFWPRCFLAAWPTRLAFLDDVLALEPGYCSSSSQLDMVQVAWQHHQPMSTLTPGVCSIPCEHLAYPAA